VQAKLSHVLAVSTREEFARSGVSLIVARSMAITIEVAHISATIATIKSYIATVSPNITRVAPDVPPVGAQFCS